MGNRESKKGRASRRDHEASVSATPQETPTTAASNNANNRTSAATRNPPSHLHSVQLQSSPYVAGPIPIPGAVSRTGPLDSSSNLSFFQPPPQAFVHRQSQSHAPTAASRPYSPPAEIFRMSLDSQRGDSRSVSSDSRNSSHSSSRNSHGSSHIPGQAAHSSPVYLHHPYNIRAPALDAPAQRSANSFQASPPTEQLMHQTPSPQTHPLSQRSQSLGRGNSHRGALGGQYDPKR